MICDIFNSKELFDKLEVFDGCASLFNYFQDYIDVAIVTVGTEENQKLKQEWFLNSDLIVSQMFCLDDDGSDKEKQKIDMSNGIMIDDKIDVLRNVNAKVKILFRNGVDAEWNKVENGDNVYIVDTWDEIGSIIDFYVNQGEVI